MSNQSRKAAQRRRVAVLRTAAFEAAWASQDDAAYLAARDRREAVKSSLDRPLSRLPYTGPTRYFLPGSSRAIYIKDLPGGRRWPAIWGGPRKDAQ